MNFEKSKVLLKKINALHEAADEGLGVSALEKDLMLQYIRDFYEAIKDKSKNKKGKSKAEKQNSPKVDTIIPEVVTPPILVSHTAPNTAQTEAEIPQHKASVDSVQVPDSDPISENTISEELNALFEESEKEMSNSRYSGGKITDIGKSMGINDKILTINDLFNGDQTLFNNTINHLNTLSSFDEAKDYLASGIAEQMNWVETAKKGKAIRFISLMRRRYSA